MSNIQGFFQTLQHCCDDNAERHASGAGHRGQTPAGHKTAAVARRLHALVRRRALAPDARVPDRGREIGPGLPVVGVSRS